MVGLPSEAITVPTTAATRRVLVAGVGYTNLRDLSFGPHLVERLRSGVWPPGVDVEDLSAGAIHVLHALQASPPYAAAILVAGIRRGDPPGTVRRSHWMHPPRPTEEVQERIGEALTGIISLDTLLTVLDHFGALPDDTLVYCTHEYTEYNTPFALQCEPDNAALKQRIIDAEALRAQKKPTVPSTLQLEKSTNPFLRCTEQTIIHSIEQHYGIQLPAGDEQAAFTALRKWRGYY